jgi:YesN/AraC family two-component response regulator
MFKILIVDDEPYIIDGLKKMINWEEFNINHIETATNYVDAVTKAMELRPDIAIFDICIKDKSCFDIITRLKAMNFTSNYILISGFSEFEFARQAIKIGVKDYLLKPINQDELKKVLTRIIIEELHGVLLEKEGRKELDSVLHREYSDFSKLVNKVLMIVQNEYRNKLSLKIIADRFMVNSAYLGQVFYKETHMKFNEYLMAYRLGIARELILDTNDKISAISYRIGYMNINYFYQLFRQYYNVSPLELRVSSGNKVYDEDYIPEEEYMGTEMTLEQ